MHVEPHLHIMMTQMRIKAGIEKFGQKESDALLQKLHQFHSWDAHVQKGKTNYQVKSEMKR